MLIHKWSYRKSWRCGIALVCSIIPMLLLIPGILSNPVPILGPVYCFFQCRSTDIERSAEDAHLVESILVLLMHSEVLN